MNAFPHSKIKAQILEDENVGRVSSKAVELISACSALFVRDLVGQDGDTTGGLHGGSVTSTSQDETKVPEGTIGVKDHEHGDEVIDLSGIKRNIIRRPEYNFLEGVLDDLTEQNAPKYDAAARKRKRQRGNPKQQSTNSKNTTNEILSRLSGENTKANVSESAHGVAMQEAIMAAQDTSSVQTTKEIIADNDEYD